MSDPWVQNPHALAGLRSWVPSPKGSILIHQFLPQEPGAMVQKYGRKSGVAALITLISRMEGPASSVHLGEVPTLLIS